MKPTIRWTIGDVSQIGLDILQESVRQIKRLYGDAFNLFVCYNTINPKKLSGLPVKLVNQAEFSDSLCIPPFDFTWKLYPPRIEMKSHEIFIDNDIIIFDKLPQFEEFLSTDDTFLFCEGRGRNLGQYGDIIPKDFTLNAGIFGLPPNYNFAKKIENIFKLYNTIGWRENKIDPLYPTTFDDQGILALCVHNKKHIKIKLTDVVILEKHEKYFNNCFGIHLVQSNRSSFHEGWNYYNEHYDID